MSACKQQRYDWAKDLNRLVIGRAPRRICARRNGYHSIVSLSAHPIAGRRREEQETHHYADLLPVAADERLSLGGDCLARRIGRAAIVIKGLGRPKSCRLHRARPIGVVTTAVAVVGRRRLFVAIATTTTTTTTATATATTTPELHTNYNARSRGVPARLRNATKPLRRSYRRQAMSCTRCQHASIRADRSSVAKNYLFRQRPINGSRMIINFLSCSLPVRV